MVCNKNLAFKFRIWLTNVVSTVAVDVTGVIVPSVAQNLIGVVGALDVAITTLVPAITGTVLGLALGEVAALVADLTVIEALVKDIVDVVVITVGTLVQGMLMCLSSLIAMLT